MSRLRPGRLFLVMGLKSSFPEFQSEMISNTAYGYKKGAKRARRAYVISESSIAVKPRMYVRILREVKIAM